MKYMLCHEFQAGTAKTRQGCQCPTVTQTYPILLVYTLKYYHFFKEVFKIIAWTQLFWNACMPHFVAERVRGILYQISMVRRGITGNTFEWLNNVREFHAEHSHYSKLKCEMWALWFWIVSCKNFLDCCSHVTSRFLFMETKWILSRMMPGPCGRPSLALKPPRTNWIMAQTRNEVSIGGAAAAGSDVVGRWRIRDTNIPLKSEGANWRASLNLKTEKLNFSLLGVKGRRPSYLKVERGPRLYERKTLGHRKAF